VREEKPPNHRPRGQPRLKAKLRPPPPPKSAQKLRQKKDQVKFLNIFGSYLNGMPDNVIDLEMGSN